MGILAAPVECLELLWEGAGKGSRELGCSSI